MTAGGVRADDDRVHGLLAAVLAVGSDLDLQTVLRRITEAASSLAGARYAALGVVGHDGQLTQFITVGLDEQDRAAIGSLPRGRGVLGLLIHDPRPLRLEDLGAEPTAYGFPPGHPPMHTFLGVPVRVRDAVFGNLYLTEKQGGGQFDAQDEAVVLALAAAAGVAIDHARLYDAARRRERWLRAIADISSELLAGAEPEQVLQLVADRACEITGATTTLVALPHDGRLLVEVAAGQDAETARGVAVAVAGTPLAAVVAGGTPLLLSGADAQQLPGVPVDGSVLLVPLRAAADARGLLALAAAPLAQGLAAVPVAELVAFAAQASVALEVAERRRDADRLVVLEDRDRIARDLHDLVIQRLFATGMQLEGAARLVERPEAAERVRRAVDDLDTTIREIRSTIYALTSPQTTGAGSLRSRLFEAVDAAVEQLGLTPAVRLSGLVDTAVPPDVAMHLLAVLREALSNTARHAGASRVDVVLEVDDVAQVVALTVRDDGRGLPAEPGRRSGLANLAERAARAGGSLRAGPGPEGGTELVWSASLAGGA